MKTLFNNYPAVNFVHCFPPRMTPKHQSFWENKIYKHSPFLHIIILVHSSFSFLYLHTVHIIRLTFPLISYNIYVHIYPQTLNSFRFKTKEQQWPWWQHLKYKELWLITRPLHTCVHIHKIYYSPYTCPKRQSYCLLPSPHLNTPK